MTTPSNDILDLLTAYALDALEPEEMARVGNMLEHDPELRRQLGELRTTVGLLPHALPDTVPPPELRQKVLDYAVGRTSRTVTPARAAVQTRGLRGWLTGLGALAAAGLVAAVITWGQLGAARTELAQTQAALEQQIALNQQVAQVVATPNQTVALSGAVGNGTVVDDGRGQLVLAANLPPLADGRVYQLWLLEGSAVPISGGTFTVDGEGVALAALPLENLPSDAVFAITEEPGPTGSAGPTSDVLISNIPAS